ncbi:MAG: hypothetical protein J6Y42_03505, partial [Bacilli bacterium]|nr:hypothetical protein [Bacilli bacterium]
MEEDDLKKILKEDIPQEVDIECDSKELLSKCKQKSKQRNKKVLRVSLVISSIVVVFLLGFSITLITNNSLNSNNRKNMGGDYKDTHEPTEPIATEPITTEPIKTEPTQTEEIGFNVTINIGDKVITYNDIKSLSIEDIEEIDHYQYLGLYLDSEFTQTFTGEISNDTTLYMDYIIFYNVIIKNIGDDINIHVNSNDDIDYKTFNMPSNKIFSGLYLDSEFTQEFTGKVNSDLVLYAKINMLYNVKVSLDNELVDDTMVLENEKYEGTIIESNPRYKEIKLYTDSLCTNEYNKEDTVNSDLTLYYGYTLNEEYNDLAIVRIHVGENVSRIEVPKGSSLGYYDLLFASHANSFGFSLFLDKECTKSYKYGPIENDLDLYQLETIPIIDYVIIDLYYWLDDNTSLGSVTISNARGEGLLLTEIGVYFNYVIEGVYIDREMTIKYNEEP